MLHIFPLRLCKGAMLSVRYISGVAVQPEHHAEPVPVMPCIRADDHTFHNPHPVCLLCPGEDHRTPVGDSHGMLKMSR